ncbi:hypothetical protein [Pseudomonas duriflava]|uniref:hypothetical protein n=1 Tax=Pseudomonas duriflava TaxID=459528 RepID=UPI00313B3139
MTVDAELPLVPDVPLELDVVVEPELLPVELDELELDVPDVAEFAEVDDSEVLLAEDESVVAVLLLDVDVDVPDDEDKLEPEVPVDVPDVAELAEVDDPEALLDVEESVDAALPLESDAVVVPEVLEVDVSDEASELAVSVDAVDVDVSEELVEVDAAVESEELEVLEIGPIEVQLVLLTYFFSVAH